jgi:hypothetical protein
MNASLHFGHGPLLALLAVFFLAMMAALAPGLSELDLSALGSAAGRPEAREAAAPATDATPTWVRDPVEPPLAGLGQAPGD